ncbi:SMP-30/gluconolactonase/LRE family protein [Pseudomonas sp. H9]|uniref:SMP-30/gluconolactonase/LRE family protein n=1 Tax=Pseudomonas sp. H9 TaxID=483968 RepID=UPI001057C9BA|nr:SMP-30/gluconolactonase/LRE family protein [Pseudomonas sp. H9]TDF82607.1 hypothetical protein E1573_13635 [Pseudomonas sp. H9]
MIKSLSAIATLAVVTTTFAQDLQAPACVTSTPATTAICGMAPAEDLELSPDGNFLFMSTTPGVADTHHSRLRLMKLVTHEVTDLAIEQQPQPGWGEASCAFPDGGVGAHGIHLSTRSDGRLQLLAVNHHGRESVEFLEPVPEGAGWKAVWRGCVQSHDGTMLNDVSATPDGGFVATAMFTFSAMKADPRLERLLDGRATGHLLAWHPDKGLARLPGSEASVPNGVQVSADGQSVWFAAWPAKAVVHYDLAQQKVVGNIALGFMPDNLSWSSKGELFTAGVPDVQTFRQCFLSRNEFCPSVSVVALIDPLNGTARELLRAPAGELFGASSALQVGRDVYVGAFAGDRLLLLRDTAAPDQRVATH